MAFTKSQTSHFSAHDKTEIPGKLNSVVYIAHHCVHIYESNILKFWEYDALKDRVEFGVSAHIGQIFLQFYHPGYSVSLPIYHTYV